MKDLDKKVAYSFNTSTEEQREEVLCWLRDNDEGWEEINIEDIINTNKKILVWDEKEWVFTLNTLDKVTDITTMFETVEIQSENSSLVFNDYTEMNRFLGGKLNFMYGVYLFIQGDQPIVLKIGDTVVRTEDGFYVEPKQDEKYWFNKEDFAYSWSPSKENLCKHTVKTLIDNGIICEEHFKQYLLDKFLK